MSRPIKRLETEILSLPAEERARLAQMLLVSLEGEAEADDSETIAQAWAEEIEKRVAEVRSGAVKLVSGEDVFKEIEDLTK